MIESGLPTVDIKDSKLVAAVAAAIQAYMQAETTAELPTPIINAWRRAAGVWQVGDQFGRKTSWRGID